MKSSIQLLKEAIITPKKLSNEIIKSVQLIINADRKKMKLRSKNMTNRNLRVNCRF